MTLPVTEPASPPRRGGRKVAWLCGLYVATVLSVWGMVVTASDEWWPATLLMFLPRWVWAAPLTILALAATWLCPRMLWALLLGLVVVVWPLMGFSFPWYGPPADPPGSFRCRVLTYNVHRDTAHLQAAIEEARPDIVALQDCPERFQPRGFGEGDWHVRNLGQFLLASRYPIREFTALHQQGPEMPVDTVVRARLETPAGMVRFYNLHLASPRDALLAIRQQGWDGGESLQANSDTRRGQSTAVSAWIGKEHGPLLVAGDFNTPPESTIYRAFWSQYTNAFAEAGVGWGYTYFAGRTALRIDHILAGPGWRCRDCRVGPSLGSEHRPVIADMEWFGTGP